MKILPFILCLLLATPLFGDEQEIFEKSIQPLLQEYCITCHSTEKQKGDLDLERFSSLDTFTLARAPSASAPFATSLTASSSGHAT
jgi:hypothetical protein